MKLEKEFDIDMHNIGRIITDKTEAFDKYFYSGHPKVHIPGSLIGDPDIIFPEYISMYSDVGELQDQNGSEFNNYDLDRNGLVMTSYTLYEPVYDGKEYEELIIALTGYIDCYDTKNEFYQFTLKSFKVEL